MRAASRVRLPGEAGYTLVEIMGVIAIMGILMSILLYGVAGIRRKGFEEGSRATIKTLQGGIDAYFNTYREYPPDGYDTPVFRQSGGSRVQIRGSQCLIYYLGFPTVQRTEVGEDVRAIEHAPFVELTADMLSGDGDIEPRLLSPDTRLVDRFGNEIHYDGVGLDPTTNTYRITERTAAVVYQGKTVTAPDPRRPRGGGGGGGLASRNKGAYDIWSNGINPEDPLDDISNWK